MTASPQHPRRPPPPPAVDGGKLPGPLRSLIRARFTEAKFRPYAQAIGEATLAWNDLHEHLARLYGMVMTPSERSRHIAVWQSSKSDRAKRDMMAAGLQTMPYEPPGWTEDLRLYIPWILRQIDRVEERRNNAVHAPLHLVADITGRPEPTERAALIQIAEVRPHTWGRNARAKRLEAKELLKEYRACRDEALELRDLVCLIGNCIERRRREQLKYALPRLPVGLQGRASAEIKAHQTKTANPDAPPKRAGRRARAAASTKAG